jgi:hypothetical protein
LLRNDVDALVHDERTLPAQTDVALTVENYASVRFAVAEEMSRGMKCVFEEKTLEEKAAKEQRQRRQTRMQELIKMSEEQQARLMNDQPITGEAESDEANKLG